MECAIYLEVKTTNSKRIVASEGPLDGDSDTPESIFLNADDRRVSFLENSEVIIVSPHLSASWSSVI